MTQGSFKTIEEACTGIALDCIQAAIRDNVYIGLVEVVIIGGKRGQMHYTRSVIRCSDGSYAYDDYQVIKVNKEG